MEFEQKTESGISVWLDRKGKNKLLSWRCPVCTEPLFEEFEDKRRAVLIARQYTKGDPDILCEDCSKLSFLAARIPSFSLE